MASRHLIKLDPDELSSITAASVDGYTLIDAGGYILDVNDSYCRMVGYSHEELLNMHMSEIDATDSVEDVSIRSKEIIKSGSQRFQTKHRHKEGYSIDVEVTANYTAKHDGMFFSFVRDISEQKRLESSLQQSEELYRSLFDNMMNGFAYCRMIYENGNPVDFVYLAVNEAFETQTGLKNVTGKKATEIIPGVRQTDNELFEIYGRVARTGQTECFEIFVSALDSWFSITVYSPFPEHFAAIFDVITERKKSINALEYANECFNQALNGSKNILYRLNVKTGYDYLSPAFEEITGHSLEEYKKVNIEKLADYYHPEDLTTARALIDQALCSRTGRAVPIEYEFRFKKADGTYCWLHDSTTACFNENDELEYYFGSAYDITERKMAEEAKLALDLHLQQTQKLESLGVLAGGIAHDFNNLLGVIIGHCSLAKLRPTKALDSIKPIEIAAERAAELCQQMLAYAGKSNFIRSEVQLSELVHEMVEMVKSSVGKNVSINSDLASDLSPITADVSQIRQVIMNLILNASEAIGDSQGEVHVCLARRDVKADQHSYDYLRNIIPPGEYACLDVTDNGCGMDDETQQRIFEPFYTTKFTGRGLGMSAVLGIINKHNGALQLFSQPGMGSTIKVFIPIQAGEIARVESPQQDAFAQWKGNGTILLVEDEEEIRTITEFMLEDLGFTVIKAMNGKEGLDLYRKHSADICLVLTDIGMPIMDGYALFRELKKLRPELPIIISSGFGDNDITSRIPREELAGLVSKPYSFDQLEKLLRSIV